MNEDRNTEVLRLEGGYLEVLLDAITYNNKLHMEDEGILSRNRLLNLELNYIKDDSTVSVVKSKLPGFIYMLIEDFAGLKSENDKLRKFHEEEGRKI